MVSPTSPEVIGSHPASPCVIPTEVNLQSPASPYDMNDPTYDPAYDSTYTPNGYHKRTSKRQLKLTLRKLYAVKNFKIFTNFHFMMLRNFFLKVGFQNITLCVVFSKKSGIFRFHFELHFHLSEVCFKIGIYSIFKTDILNST